jgi:hypothetical protein
VVTMQSTTPVAIGLTSLTLLLSLVGRAMSAER